MKRVFAILLALSVLCTLAAGCSGSADAPETTAPETTVPETTVPETTVPETTVPETTVPATTEPIIYDSFYYFYDYQTDTYTLSEVATFQDVTGAVCMASALDFGFLSDDAYENMSVGYDEQYAVFMYAYDEEMLDAYIGYLESLGFTYLSSESFNEGVSYYYQNADNGYTFDVFVKTDAEGGYEYVALEPYLNGDAGTEGTFYYFYDYATNEYEYSDVSAYQDFTGAACLKSMLDWGFLGDSYTNIVDGYDAEYALFMYSYEKSQLEDYVDYLTSLGYSYMGYEEFDEGTSFYYQNPSDGRFFDLFVAEDQSYVVIEPCMNRD